MTDRREREIEPRRADLMEPGVDVLGLAFVDLANEAQRQMIIAGIDPFRAGQAVRQQRQRQLYLRRQGNADEEPQHES